MSDAAEEWSDEEILAQVRVLRRRGYGQLILHATAHKITQADLLIRQRKAGRARRTISDALFADHSQSADRTTEGRLKRRSTPF